MNKGCRLHGETEHDGCRLCFLYRTDPRYRKLWGGDEIPGLIARAASFVKSAARHVAAGCPQVSDDEKQRRLSLCQVCPEFDAEKVKCRKCGCRLAVKASWQLEKCPLSRW